MRPIFWVTALAVLSIAHAKNATAKTKPKRQLDNIRTPQNLQYSLVLPHSRVSHFRALTSSRRISNATPKGGKLPPYAVQMEPVVQYSQKDPLYDPNLNNLDDVVVNKNEIYAQPKILNVQDSSEISYGPPFGTLPTAPLYSQEPHQHYYEAPEPIIEIIIKESNETLPPPPPQLVQKRKKEPVQVFYVKYSKDPHSKDKVIYEKPIAAITPPSNDEDDHHNEYVTVTPEPIYLPTQTTTLRAIIKPESEVYHSDSSVKVTFGNEGHHYSDRREGNLEGHEETAPRPAIAYPNQPPNHPPLERSVSPKPQLHEPRPVGSHQASQIYRPNPPQAQNRIQFQSPYLNNEQQLPRQGSSVAPFRGQGHVSRQNSFGPLSPQPSSHPAFAVGPPGPGPHFTNPGPSSPPFPGPFSRPNSPPSFHPRPNSPPTFAPRPQFNGPPRSNFHTGPQRPIHQPHPQQKPFFDEAKYLQENYHTITTDQIDPAKEQLIPNRHPQNFNFGPSPSPAPAQFQDHNQSPIIPVNQQLPQQRPPLHFTENVQNKPSFTTSPSRSPFFNLKPSPPQIENNRPPFLQHQPQQQFSFHQGLQPLSRPSVSVQPNLHTQQSFASPVSVFPSPIPQSQFLPQPSAPTLFNFHPQPSPGPEQQQFQKSSFSSESTQFQQSQGPSERPSSFHDQSNFHHQQNVGQFVPNGGELVAAIPKYEQHITVNGPNVQTNYNGFSESPQPSPSTSPDAKYHLFQQQQQQHQQQEQQKEQQRQQHQQEQHKEQQRQQHQQQQQQAHQQQQQAHQQQQQHQHEQQQQQKQQQQQQQQRQQQQQQQLQQQQQQQEHQQYLDNEQEQVRLQLAQNVQKQQEEIQRLQNQLIIAQQQQKHQQQQNKQFENEYNQLRNYNQQQIQASTPRSQYSQSHESSRTQYQQQQFYTASTPSPHYYQSTSRTVEIKPTTQKYVSSTLNSISSTPETKKEEKKRKPAIELPDEVPDDLRQQLLSSGILDNADISVLDYDKVGDTPLESLPPDQLANFFSAGGAQQIAASEHRPIVVKPNGDSIESRIDEDIDDDQEIAASENVATYVAPPTTMTNKQAVEMKVVHFDPNTAKGQNIAKEYVKDDATQLDPVALNDKKYNRYLPLKVSGNQFPLPDVLKGRKVTSVVVLAPVETEALNGDHVRKERATNTLKGIKFVAGDSLQDLLRKPTTDNFKKWLEVEKKTATDLQSVILLVTGSEEPSEEREIFMYDVASGNVNKLSGDLSNAFVEAAENNSLSKDIEKLAIEGEGTPETFSKNDEIADGSENVPLFVDISGLSLNQGNSNQVSISSGYSKTKLGRSLRRH